MAPDQLALEDFPSVVCSVPSVGSWCVFVGRPELDAHRVDRALALQRKDKRQGHW